MSDATKRPCREVECAGGQHVPTGRTELLTNEELADRNRANVKSTQRWFMVPSGEPLDHEAILALEDACTVGAGATTKYTRELSTLRVEQGAVLRAFIARAVQLADLSHPEALINHVREHGLAALDGDAAGLALITAFGKLDAEAAALRAALEFYAAPETYFAIGFFPDRPCGDFIDDCDDTGDLGVKPGKRARTALGAALSGNAGLDLLAERDTLKARLERLEASGAARWEANHQRAVLEHHGLTDFDFGCDSIDAVCEALLGTRAERDQLLAEVGTLRSQLTAMAQP
jgi:hypothetical protein